MSFQSHRPTLSVDLSALIRNAKALKSRSPTGEIAACVKADAYGVGSIHAAAALSSGANVNTFFVAYAEEAALIVDALGADTSMTFFVLNGPAPGCAEIFGQYDNVLPVISTASQARLWQSLRADGRCAVALDIGMNRLGMSVSDAADLIPQLGAESVVHLMAHLSHSSDLSAPQNSDQINQYTAALDMLDPLVPVATWSLSASGGMMLSDPVDQDLTRPGASLYGLSPTGHSTDALDVVATLTAPVVQVRDVQAGETVGYNGRWTATKASRIAILSIGYADGIPRALSGSGSATINGKTCPIVGAISMDLTAIDVSDVPDGVAEGDRAELYGPTVRIDDQATVAGTIGYEMLSSLGPRIERVYVD